MANALEIPEIRLRIGLFLASCELAACTRVSRSWNDTFTVLLWRVCSVISHSSRNPTLEALNKHADQIRDLRYYGHINHGYFSPECSRLASLTVDGDWTLALESSIEVSVKLSHLIQKNQSTLTHFQFGDHHAFLSAIIWNAMAACPNIEFIQLRHSLVNQRDMEAFWEACSKVETLHLICPALFSLRFGFKTGLTTRVPVLLPKLRHLKMEGIDGISNVEQLQVVMRAPNLCSLDWTAAMDPESPQFPQDAYQEMMSRRACPQLKDLAISEIFMSDDNIALALNAMTTAEGLRLGWCGFAENGFRSLIPRHSKTIRVLELAQAYDMTSAMVQEILCSCPLLEVVRLDRIQGTELVQFEQGEAAFDPKNGDVPKATVGRDWVCLGLKSLSMSFDLSASNSDATRDHIASDISTDDEDPRRKQYELEQYHAFRQISRLSRLETLDFGDMNTGRPKPAAQNLDLRLRERGGGLQALASLRKLKLLRFFYTSQELGEEEIDWMVDHWPRFYMLLGYLHPDGERDRELRDYFRRRRNPANAFSVRSLI
ncbi:hypothetical protein BGZ58_005232 [Dissophora ornata]|nr:hypothetical protein BGZ58_005232 [Dissophora ornata]